jgi:hypothetical protein
MAMANWVKGQRFLVEGAVKNDREPHLIEKIRETTQKASGNGEKTKSGYLHRPVHVLLDAALVCRRLRPLYG